MIENSLTVQVIGHAGSGKSTISRIISKALQEAGFLVLLSDVDDMNQEKFDKCAKALRGTTSVDIFCIQAKPKQGN